MKMSEEQWQRLKQERLDLGEKLGKLEAFALSEKFKLLPYNHQCLLHQQEAAMYLYHEILTERCNLLKPRKKGKRA